MDKTVRDNAVIFVDFENIRRIVSTGYNIDIRNLTFFNKLYEFLSPDYRIINTIIYDNFDKDSGLQTLLKPKGYECKASSGNGKNAADIELTVDIVRTLYKNPHIEAYIIITSDRDVVPVLNEIKREQKLSYLISSLIHFNRYTIGFADKHKYLEDIFDNFATYGQPITSDQTRISSLAYEVSKLFYKSNIYQKYIKTESISLTGYVKILNKVLQHDSPLIMDALKLAGQLGLIEIYTDQTKGLCIKDGPQMNQLKFTQGGST